MRKVIEEHSPDIASHILLLGSNYSRQSKIADFDIELVINEKIHTLQVTVNQVAAMQVFQSARHLQGNADFIHIRQLPLRMFTIVENRSEDTAQIALHQVHDKEILVCLGVCVASITAYQIGVLNQAHDGQFALEFLGIGDAAELLHGHWQTIPCRYTGQYSSDCTVNIPTNTCASVPEPTSSPNEISAGLISRYMLSCCVSGLWSSFQLTRSASASSNTYARPFVDWASAEQIDSWLNA